MARIAARQPGQSTLPSPRKFITHYSLLPLRQRIPVHLRSRRIVDVPAVHHEAGGDALGRGGDALCGVGLRIDGEDALARDSPDLLVGTDGDAVIRIACGGPERQGSAVEDLARF